MPSKVYTCKWDCFCREFVDATSNRGAKFLPLSPRRFLADVRVVCAHGLAVMANDRHDGPLSAPQETPEAQDRALLVLDVVAGGHGHAAMTQRLARGKEPVAGVDLRAEFLAQRVEWLA